MDTEQNQGISEDSGMEGIEENILEKFHRTRLG